MNSASQLIDRRAVSIRLDAPHSSSGESGLAAFRPHPLLRSGHMQTIYGAMVSGPLPPYQAQTQIIPLPDGEALVAHEEQTSSPPPPDAPLVVLVHGLGGDHRSPYLRRIASRLAASGMRVWRADLRGCGAGLRYAYRPAHAGSSSDLAAIVSAAQQRYPESRQAIAAFSLGGNLLLKMLGELAEDPERLEIDPAQIVQAIAVAPPADLHGCTANMERFSRMLYTRYYLKLLARQVRERADHWDAWRSISPASPPRTIRQFDHWYTAPLAGFSSTDEYYTQSSSARWLSKVAVPTALLIDQHDPIIPFGAFDGHRFSPSISVEVTRFGGHLGYIARDRLGRVRRWMDEWTEAKLKQAFAKD